MFLSGLMCVCVCVYLCKEKKAIKQIRLFREFITQCKRRVYGILLCPPLFSVYHVNQTQVKEIFVPMLKKAKKLSLITSFFPFHRSSASSPHRPDIQSRPG